MTHYKEIIIPYLHNTEVLDSTRAKMRTNYDVLHFKPPAKTQTISTFNTDSMSKVLKPAKRNTTMAKKAFRKKLAGSFDSED